MKKTLLVISTLTLFACGGTKSVSKAEPVPEPTVAQLASHYTNANEDQLNNGKALFEKGCDQCHGLKKSFGVSSERLMKVVPDMVGKANKKAGQTLISSEGGENVLHYLLALNAK